MWSDGIWRDWAPVFINCGEWNEICKFKENDIEIMEVSRESKVGGDDDLSSKLMYQQETKEWIST